MVCWQADRIPVGYRPDPICDAGGMEQMLDEHGLARTAVTDNSNVAYR